MYSRSDYSPENNDYFRASVADEPKPCIIPRL